MDLKTKDVANLLSVPESTVQHWADQGKIPAYRINQQLLFSRSEIEDWLLMHRKLEEQGKENIFSSKQASAHEKGGHEDTAPAGSQHFNLYRAINKGGVISHIPGKDKEEVIRNATKTIAQRMHLDAEVLTDLLLDRERLQPTSLSHGIAIPHTRDFLLNTPHDIVTVVYPEHPLEYGALDGKPVHTLFFLFASDDKKHLHLLAKIAHMCSLPDTWEFLRSKPSQEALLAYVKDWESKLKKSE